MNWHENDQFWSGIGAQVFLGQLTDSQISHQCQLISRLLSENASVLDMCCGKGGHAVQLAKLGFQVAAVDSNKDFLKAARLQADREAVKVELICDDMRRFRREKAFDAVLSLSTSFGFFRDQENDRSAAQNFRHCLKPGGMLIMDLMGKEILAKHFIKRDWCQRGDTIFTVERHASDNWTWIEERWLAISGNGVQEYSISYRSYSAAELIALLEKAGFASVKAFGDLSHSAYDEDATRLVVQALT